MKNIRFQFAIPSNDPTHKHEPQTRIKTLGIGGCGGNVINTILKRLNPTPQTLTPNSFIAINTDKQDLSTSNAPTKIQIGQMLTKGLGSGGNPEIGKMAGEENIEDVKTVIKNTDVIFLTCGMGGGTGTGASPVIAKIAKQLGAFTIAVVTFPFDFEGTQRARQAEQGISELKKSIDALVILPNQRLFSMTNEKTPLKDAFELVNQTLAQTLHGVTEIILSPGLVNVDFADVRTLMSQKGDAFVGIGNSQTLNPNSQNNRALHTIQQAINSSFLTRSCIREATGALIHITGGENLTLSEANDAVSSVKEIIHPNANIIFGVYIDPSMTAQTQIRITIIVTGIKNDLWKPYKYTEQNLKIPTFRRKKTLFYQPASDGLSETQHKTLEIPTFLRRQNGLKS